MAQEQVVATEAIAFDALAVIARGRRDNGRPLAGEAARQTARGALAALGITWTQPEQPPLDAAQQR